MFQKATSSLLLICALLFAQLAAVQHQQVHFANAVNHSQSDDQHTGAKLCEQCAFQAELGHALAQQNYLLVEFTTSNIASVLLRAGFKVHVLLPYPARAPPIFS